MWFVPQSCIIYASIKHWISILVATLDVNVNSHAHVRKYVTQWQGEYFGTTVKVLNRTMQDSYKLYWCHLHLIIIIFCGYSDDKIVLNRKKTFVIVT